MDMFAKAQFIDKCLAGLKYGAISDLLQNIIKVPCTSEDINEMKEVSYIVFDIWSLYDSYCISVPCS